MRRTALRPAYRRREAAQMPNSFAMLRNDRVLEHHEVRAWRQKMIATLKFVEMVAAIIALVARMRGERHPSQTARRPEMMLMRTTATANTSRR